MEDLESNEKQWLLAKLNELSAAMLAQDLDKAFAVKLGMETQGVSFHEFISDPQFQTIVSRPLEHRWQLDENARDENLLSARRNIDKLVCLAKLCCEAPHAPIVAVLGLLNAGKSSLVSTYLSEENRNRILVGAANSQGTHRFVIWLPEAWRTSAGVWEFVEAKLESVFGCKPELLSSDPVEAAKQYNDISLRSLTDQEGQTRQRPTIEIPLVATDKELDTWGIALMDCPDVQTGELPVSTNDLAVRSKEVGQLYHEHSHAIAEARLAVLAGAAPLCSAFLVVLPANAMHDQTVSRLLRLLTDRMPNVQRIVAVNRVPRKYLASEIAAEVHKLYGHFSISRQYMAYGFDGPALRERIPVPPKGFRPPQDRSLPLFFRLDSASESQPPSEIPEKDWLLNIGEQLSKNDLFQDALKSTLEKLVGELRVALRSGDEMANRQRNARLDIARTVANACYDFSLDKQAKSGAVRLQASRQIVLQISRSLERTAPWWAMPGRWTTRVAEAGKANLANTLSWLKLPGWFTGKTEAIGHWIRTRWTTGQNGKIVTADMLLNFLKLHDLRGHLGLDHADTQTGEAQKACLRQACQEAIDRFQEESTIELNDAELDVVTARMWSEMPLKKRLLTGLAPAGILFAPLLAVVMVPLDFGGSAVLVFASLKELLFAGVAGVGLVMASADSMPKIAESEVAWQQLGDLFAVLCDAIGLSRPLADEIPAINTGLSSRQISASRIPERASGMLSGKTCLPAGYRINNLVRLEIDRILGEIASKYL